MKTMNYSLIRILFALVIGLVLVLWPNTAASYIVITVGVAFLIPGVISLFGYFGRKKSEDGVSPRFPIEGVGSLLFGLWLIVMPEFFADVLMFLLGFILVIAAVGQFVTLAAARQFGYVAPISYLFPVIILIAGIIVLFDPFSSAEGVFILFGATLIFYGITDLVNQYAINKLRKSNDEKEKIQRMDGAQDVEDADYEEVKPE